MVRDVLAQEIVLVADQQQAPKMVIAHDLQRIEGPAHVVDQVAAHIDATENPDLARIRFGVVASSFKRLPGALQEHALLWIEPLRFSWVIPKEGSVKQLDIVDDRLCRDEIRFLNHLGIDTGSQRFLWREKGDRFYAVAEILPELLRGVGARETKRHADDRDLLLGLAARRQAVLGALVR